MDSINSWINEDEVRKLAEDLSASPEEAKEWRDNNFDGFAIPDQQGESSKKAESNVEDITQEVKESKSSSLAGASAMAASSGLFSVKKDREHDVAKKLLEEATAEKAKVAAFMNDVARAKEVIDYKNKSNDVKTGVDAQVAESVSQPSMEGGSVETDVDHVAALPATCDHSFNTVPVNVADNAKVILPSVHAEKGLGTFEQIDKQLTNTVKAKGICVIDRDGDVLYSSMKNAGLVAFTVDSMVDTKLMRTQDGEFGNIRVKVSAGEYMEFVSVKTTRGVLILAASMDHVLGSKNAEYVAGDVLKIANMD